MKVLEFLAHFAISLLASIWVLRTMTRHSQSQRIAREMANIQEIGNGEEDLDSLRPFTFQELRQHNGVDLPTAYISVKDVIFNVTGSDYYKVGGAYGTFVGRDASIALALMSTDSKDMDLYHKRLGKLPEKKVKSLNNWYTRTYAKKYEKVGVLVECPWPSGNYTSSDA